MFGASVEEMLEQCESVASARNHDLTDWELKFIRDIRAKFDQFGSLTEAQEQKLAEIWRDKA